MKSVTQLPREKVAAIRPEQLETYATAKGWTLDEAASDGKAAIYRYPGIPQAELLVPRHHTFIDYPLRVGEVLHNLAVVEARTIWEVFLEFSDFGNPSPRNGNAKSGRRTKSLNGTRTPIRKPGRSKTAAKKVAERQ